MFRLVSCRDSVRSMLVPCGVCMIIIRVAFSSLRFTVIWVCMDFFMMLVLVVLFAWSYCYFNWLVGAFVWVICGFMVYVV